ncbi:MAG: YdcF family protein [Chitinophagaceae bacterium]|nr:YdcF family protein [Chitinophagaceae bacterium]
MFKRRQVPGIILIVFLLAAVAPGCMFSERSAQRLYDKASRKSYDMVIIPGLPLGDSLQWDRILRGRIYWAKFLLDKGIAKNVMFSGAAVHSPYYEGLVMAMYAEAIGIPKEKIYTELLAEHSTENLYYSYKKAKKLGFKTIALASDPFQSKQLKSFAHLRLSRSIGIIPFVIDTMKTLEPLMKDPVIDHQKAFKKDFVALVERESRWKRIKGTIGWNRDKKAYQ